MLLVLVSATLLLVQTAHSSTVLLKFTHPSQWESSFTGIQCLLDAVLPRKISKLRIWSVENTEGDLSEVSYDCTSGNVTQVKDSTNGRLQQDDRVNATLVWNPLEYADQGIYMCAVTVCGTSGAELRSVNNASLTVVKRPTQPLMQPAQPIAVYVNKTTTVDISCQGYVGYPGGRLYLTYKDANNPFTKELEEFQVNETGHGYGSHKLERALFTNIQSSYIFSCVTSNTAGNRTISLSTVNVVSVEYALTENTFTVKSFYDIPPLESLGDNNYLLNANFPNDILISCTGNSNPASFSVMNQTEGSTDGVTVESHGNPALVSVIRKDGQELNFRLVIECSSKYESTVAPEKSKQVKSTLTIVGSLAASKFSFTVVLLNIAAFLLTSLTPNRFRLSF